MHLANYAQNVAGSRRGPGNLLPDKGKRPRPGARKPVSVRHRRLRFAAGPGGDAISSSVSFMSGENDRALSESNAPKTAPGFVQDL